MPASATSVRAAGSGGGGGGGAWTPLGGEDVAVPWGAGQMSASLEFRLVVPMNALPAGAAVAATASQAVTYTVTYGAPPE